MPVPRTGNRPDLRLVPSQDDGGRPDASANRRPDVLHVVETDEDALRSAPVRAALDAAGRFRQVQVDVEDRRAEPPTRRHVAAELALPPPDRRLVLDGD